MAWPGHGVYRKSFLFVEPSATGKSIASEKLQAVFVTGTIAVGMEDGRQPLSFPFFPAFPFQAHAQPPTPFN